MKLGSGASSGNRGVGGHAPRTAKPPFLGVVPSVTVRPRHGGAFPEERWPPMSSQGCEHVAKWISYGH
ncbi:hypothetical protein DRP04_14215 [Archaeoglobales archaeon]|nr:MAG: hypothetical protein DRP04_14215 [Archaeoglobales archaeon]